MSWIPGRIKGLIPHESAGHCTLIIVQLQEGVQLPAWSSLHSQHWKIPCRYTYLDLISESRRIFRGCLVCQGCLVNLPRVPRRTWELPRQSDPENPKRYGKYQFFSMVFGFFQCVFSIFFCVLSIVSAHIFGGFLSMFRFFCEFF